MQLAESERIYRFAHFSYISTTAMQQVGQPRKPLAVGPNRPMTAPSAGRRIIRPFYGNDIGLKPTGDTAGRYTFNSARTKQYRPTSAVTTGSGATISGDAGCRPKVRPSTAAVRRRFFFPQTINVSKTSTKQTPFYSHYDVTIPAEPDQNSIPEDVPSRLKNHQSFYYRDYNQHQMEHYAQNRDLAPLAVDVEELRTWLTTARPRTAMDAGPLLILCQNLMQSLLEEKQIVFERRAEEEKAEKDRVVDELNARIKGLEGELELSKKDKDIAVGKTDGLLQKLADSQEKADRAHRLVRCCQFSTLRCPL